MVISQLEKCDDEFTVQELVKKSKELDKAFSASRISHLLSSLSDAGLVYKNRHGKHSLAVPLLSKFIQRQIST
jgi:DNA-binding transcriptional ArsR family regulator